MRYLVSLKTIITYIFSYYLAKIKFNSYVSLPKEKTMTFHNVILIHIKSALNKDENH